MLYKSYNYICWASFFFTHYLTLPGMALGFFFPRYHMSGQIGVPSILGGSQNLGDPPLRNLFVVVMRKSD